MCFSDLFLANVDTFWERNPELLHAEGANVDWSGIAKTMIFTTVPSTSWCMQQRSEVIMTSVSHVTPVHEIGSIEDPTPPALTLNPSGQKTFGQGIKTQRQEKLLLHSGRGEGCCRVPDGCPLSRREYWYQEARKPGSWEPGWCGLCLHIQTQTFLDMYHPLDPKNNGQERKDNPNAVLNPYCDAHGIHWNKSFSPQHMTEANRFIIARSNNQRAIRKLPLKDESKITSHSVKVGSIQECAARRYAASTISPCRHLLIACTLNKNDPSL